MTRTNVLVAIASASMLGTIDSAACHAASFKVHSIEVTFNGESAQSLFGTAVAGAGDVNADGFDDIIVGAFNDSLGAIESGTARVFSGATGALLYAFSGDSQGDQFGASVAGAGDVNADGFADLIVGAYLDDNNGQNSGSARVFCGATGSILLTLNGDSAGDQFGISVAGVGDLNFDGSDDVIVGAWRDGNNGQASGSARVFSGASGAVLFTFNGDSPGDHFGVSVARAGDVDADGFADLIVGAYLDDNNGMSSGSARVFSGASGEILYTFNGDSAFDSFGRSVSGAGDVNNDGVDDLIVGAFQDSSNGSSSGRARVFSGATGAILHTFDGDSQSDFLGYSVAGAGDLNNDGFADLIVGVYQDDINGTDSGRVRVFSGTDGGVLYTFDGDAAGALLGHAVASAGDVNGDGVPDLLAGAYGTSTNGPFSGSARLYISSPGGWPKTAPPAPCVGDADGNRTVNFSDITTVLSNFGIACP